MVGVAEAAGAGLSELAGGLFAGLDELTARATVTFTLYRRVVLPLDGSVFWVRADLLSPSAGLNSALLNATAPDQASTVSQPAATIQATGSLHYSSNAAQEEDNSSTTNRMVFTSEVEIADFNAVGPTTMYVGEYDGLRFAFNSRGSFFRRAALHHYVGNAVFSWMETQLIDDPSQLRALPPVVSNSLPAWLAMTMPVPVFPSMLVPQDQPPPYATVHIPGDGTRPLQPLAWTDQDSGSTYQLLADRVRLTLIGLNAYAALDLVKGIMDQIGPDGDALGLMNMPVIRDAKRGQTELGVLAQQKTVEFEVSYYQARLRQLAAQYIVSCVPSYLTSRQDLANWGDFNWDSGALWWAPPPTEWGGSDWDEGSQWQ